MVHIFPGTATAPTVITILGVVFGKDFLEEFTLSSTDVLFVSIRLLLVASMQYRTVVGRVRRCFLYLFQSVLQLCLPINEPLHLS